MYGDSAGKIFTFLKLVIQMIIGIIRIKQYFEEFIDVFAYPVCE